MVNAYTSQITYAHYKEIIRFHTPNLKLLNSAIWNHEQCQLQMFIEYPNHEQYIYPLSNLQINPTTGETYHNLDWVEWQIPDTQFINQLGRVLIEYYDDPDGNIYLQQYVQYEDNHDVVELLQKSTWEEISVILNDDTSIYKSRLEELASLKSGERDEVLKFVQSCIIDPKKWNILMYKTGVYTVIKTY